MKRLLIPALEELETEIEVGEFEDVEVPEDIDAAMLLTMEADEDVQEEFENMDQIDETVDDVESAVERLENIAEIVRQFGISGPIMKAADPYRELVEAGICTAYEELSDEPVIGEDSIAVAEAIESIMDTSEEFGLISIESKIDDLVNAGSSVYAGTQIAKQGNLSKAKVVAKSAKDAIASKAGKVGSAIKGAPGKVGSAVKGAPGALKGAAGKAGSMAKGAVAAATKLGGVKTAAIAAAAVAIGTIATLVYRSMSTHKGALKNAEKKLASISSFDDDKFKGMTKKVLSKDEFGRAVKGADVIIKIVNTDSLTKIADQIESMIGSGSVTVEKIDAVGKKAADLFRGISNQDVRDILGIDIVVSEGGLDVVRPKPTVIKSKGNLGEKGWTPELAKSAVKEAIRVTTEGETMSRNIKSSVSAINKIVTSLNRQVKENEDVDKAVAKAGINQIKKIIDAHKATIKAAVKAIYVINGTAVNVGKAAISCGE